MKRRHVLSNSQRSAAEEARALAEARRPKRGWVCDLPRRVWTKEGVLYVVFERLEGAAPEPKRRWAASDPPFLVVCPAGVKMGGSSHLDRAQRMAEVLGVPLPDRPKKDLDDDADLWSAFGP
jgi:hypothetical protein